MKNFSVSTFAALLVLSATQPAFAHTGQHLGGWAAGLAHPFLGLDHLTVMAAVGIWAALQNRTTAAMAMLSFPLFMLIGTGLALSGAALPGVETVIALSVFAMGWALIGGSAWLAQFVGLLIPLFSIFHGYAHGSELPLTAAPLDYAMGFVGATAVLHGLGFVTGRTLLGRDRRRWLRWAGALTGLFGTWLLIAG